MARICRLKVVWNGRAFAWEIKDLGMISKGLYNDVGEKPRTLVENGAVVEPAISGNHRNVVQVPVIVEYKTVNFKLQGQTLGGQGQTRDICGSCFRGASPHR